jgi:hypothetical protein
MKIDRTNVSGQLELLPVEQPRTLCLADVVRALHAVARDDAEAAAVLEYMLSEGHVRLAGAEALAA